jgi:hypothetical protein
MFSNRNNRRIFWAALVALLFATGVMASDFSSNLTVKASLIKAVGLSRGHDIFNIYGTQKDGTPLRDRFRDVEIRAEQTFDGAVRVAFSLPSSDVIVSDGRKSSGKMLEVNVSSSSSSSKDFILDRGEVSKADEDRTCVAIAIVLEKHLKEKPVLDVVVGTMMGNYGKGLTVLITRIPYMPGGHTFYYLSERNEIEKVVGGR